MKANPGGYIEPTNVVGRDDFIKTIWNILEQQSLVLTAERRIGKTSILNKMEAENKALQNNSFLKKHLIFKGDLEGFRSPLEFVEWLYKEIQPYLSPLQKNTTRISKFLSKFGETEIAGILKLPKIIGDSWKILLNELISDLMENQTDTPIFFFDEFPMMLDNIVIDHGEKAAMEMLDVLRALRQTYPKLRMIYTGSIGLHHVIRKLKKAGYANDPTNDMKAVDVSPLAIDDAQDLALKLLKGENISTQNLEEVAKAIAENVDGFPFYIHGIVSELKQHKDVDVKNVNELVNEKLVEGNDSWHLGHYESRIHKYYSSDESKISLIILDILASADKLLSFNEIFNLLKSEMLIEDKEIVRKLLRLLQQDHYITRQTDGCFHFRLSIIKRFWKINRG
ncbi:MAG: ATP-binding protein [Blastocatellia bacterium]|nr:ATP-binding protein [Blastocatellia bacterium]